MRPLTPALIRSCLVSLSLGAPAGASCGQDLSSEARAVLERMSSEDHASRVEAQEMLRNLDPWPGEALWAVARDRSLPAEAHARLLRALYEEWALEPRGAMGVQFGTPQPGEPAPASDGVVIQTVITERGFDAENVLEDGDIIESADGVSMRGLGGTGRANGLLAAIIVMRSPGDPLPMRVRRGGEALDVEVTMGSLSQLDGRNRIDVDDMRTSRAFFVKLGMEGIWPYADDGAVGGGLTGEDLARASLDGGDPGAGDRERVQTRARSGHARRGASAGGAPRLVEPIASTDRAGGETSAGLWGQRDASQLWASLGEYAALSRRLVGEEDEGRRASIRAEMDEIAARVRPGRERLSGGG